MRLVPQLAIGLALVLVAACRSSAPLHVVVDPTVAAGDVYEVQGMRNRHWGQALTFGGFATQRTRVGETWSWTGGLFDLGGGVRTQPYRFVFVDEAGDEWQVECRAKTPILRHSDDHGSWEVPLGETRLGCAMRDSQQRVHQLAVRGTGFDFSGEFDSGAEAIEIRSLHTIPDRDGNPRRFPGVLGYELRRGDRVLSSVDLLGKGRVYLAREAPADLRGRLAMIATVLMFFGEG
jgi:hypothetical protein